MPGLIATLYHITDLHLFVDESGRTREELLRSARLLSSLAHRGVPLLGSLAAGAIWHQENALRALEAQLPAEVARERYAQPDAPVLVLQTGDVEALGSGAPAGHTEYRAFPSFAWVHSSLRSHEPTWIDIYGNHDTWPGTYPPTRVRERAINRRRIATVPGLKGPWPDVQRFEGASGIPVDVARINTVSRTLLKETLASGAIGDHPPAGAGIDAVAADLRGKLRDSQAGPAVRIAVMHHPPHPFEAGWWTRELSTGKLHGAQRLAQVLGERRVQLVVAGHRHKLDPARDAKRVGQGRQPPLRPPTVQLVAESPTQEDARHESDRSAYEGLQRHSFSRYRLWTEGGGRFDVERTVFAFDDNASVFIEGAADPLFEGISLE